MPQRLAFLELYGSSSASLPAAYTTLESDELPKAGLDRDAIHRITGRDPEESPLDSAQTDAVPDVFIAGQT